MRYTTLILMSFPVSVARMDMFTENSCYVYGSDTRKLSHLETYCGSVEIPLDRVTYPASKFEGCLM